MFVSSVLENTLMDERIGPFFVYLNLWIHITHFTYHIQIGMQHSSHLIPRHMHGHITHDTYISLDTLNTCEGRWY